MKLFCRNDHYKIEGTQIFLVSKSKRQKKLARGLVDTLETQIRQQIFMEICAVPLLNDRTAIVKYGIDNAVLKTQDILARVALKNNVSPHGMDEDNKAITGILNDKKTKSNP